MIGGSIAVEQIARQIVADKKGADMLSCPSTMSNPKAGSA
jgi:hypothetical protein